jgi:hypothetical protein
MNQALMMNFSLVKLILILVLSLNVNQINASTSLATGKYEIELTVLDSEEKYPVSISFKAFTGKDLKVYLTGFNINYSGYGCKASNKNISYRADFVRIEEKLIVGKDYCEASGYLIFPKENSQYFFEKIINLTDGENIPTFINKVSFSPDSYAENQGNGAIAK